MIIGKLTDSARIESLHPNFGRVFNYIKELSNIPLESEQIVLDGENLYINHALIDGTPQDKQLLEIHRKYIDIHILLEGEETIGWKPTEDLLDESIPYSPEKDCAFYTDTPTSFITILPGEFVIAFPEDAHAPAIGKGKIHKLVAKIRI